MSLVLLGLIFHGVCFFCARAEIEVMNVLKMIDEVNETHLIYGVYDIIARIEADTMEDLRKVIGCKVRRLTKVRSTITMICL